MRVTRMRWCRNVLVIFGMATITALAAAPQDAEKPGPNAGVGTQFLGVSMGAPFDVTQCPNGYVIPPELKRCWLPRRGQPPVDTSAKSYEVTLISLDFPEGVQEVTVLVVEGNAVAVFVKTSGIASQESILVNLREKYGRPTDYDSLTMQNAFGAIVPVAHAKWAADGYEVEYMGAVKRFDAGFISAKTASGAAHMKDRKKQRPGF